MSMSALLVDIDNTVYAYGPCHEAGLREAWRSLQALPTVWSSEDSFRESYAHARGVVKSRVGLQAAAHSRLLYFKEMLEQGYSVSRLDQAVALSDSYWRGFAACMQPDPDCLDVLRECKRTMSIAWVSNYTTKRQIWKLGLLGLSETANYLVTSEEAGAEKPDPRPFRLALEKLRLNAETVFAVGDSYAEDVLAARACGMDCAWLLRDQAATQSVESVFPVRSWKELRKVLYERRSN